MAACSTHRAGGADDEDRLRGVPLEELDQRLSLARREDARLQLAIEAEVRGELLRPCGVLRAVIGGHHDALDGKRRGAVLVLAPLALGAALRWKRFSSSLRDTHANFRAVVYLVPCTICVGGQPLWRILPEKSTTRPGRGATEATARICSS